MSDARIDMWFLTVMAIVMAASCHWQGLEMVFIIIVTPLALIQLLFFLPLDALTGWELSRTIRDEVRR